MNVRRSLIADEASKATLSIDQATGGDMLWVPRPIFHIQSARSPQGGARNGIHPQRRQQPSTTECKRWSRSSGGRNAPISQTSNAVSCIRTTSPPPYVFTTSPPRRLLQHPFLSVPHITSRITSVLVHPKSRRAELFPLELPGVLNSRSGCRGG